MSGIYEDQDSRGSVSDMIDDRNSRGNEYRSCDNSIAVEASNVYQSVEYSTSNRDDAFVVI